MCTQGLSQPDVHTRCAGQIACYMQENVRQILCLYDSSIKLSGGRQKMYTRKSQTVCVMEAVLDIQAFGC